MKQATSSPNIPPFRADGYVPEGVHVCSEAEVIFRFGSLSRRRLVLRLRRWIELGRQVGVRRLLVDGSFVTAKEDPHDIGTVILLPQHFTQQLAQEYAPALELQAMVLTRRPEEIFAKVAYPIQQRGRDPGHSELMPAEPISFESYVELLKHVVLRPVQEE